MSIISNSRSLSREFRTSMSIDRMLAQKMHSLTQNIKKVSETKQILQQSFHQSRYTYSELQKMYNKLFEKYKQSLTRIEKLEQQMAIERIAKQMVIKQQSQLQYSLNENNFVNVHQIILNFNQLKEKYQVERKYLLRKEKINSELIKIVEECLQKIENSDQQCQKTIPAQTYFKDEQNNTKQMVEKIRDFLDFISTSYKDELLLKSKVSLKRFPQSDSIKQVLLSEEYHFQTISSEELQIPQLKERTLKDEQTYLSDNKIYSNPYVSELLERISERSREEIFTDRSMNSSKQKIKQNKNDNDYENSEIRWQNLQKVRQCYEMSDIINRSQYQYQKMPADIEQFQCETGQKISKITKPNKLQQSPITQPTPQHLYNTLLQIERKFSQLQQSSAQQINQNQQQKYQLRQQNSQLQQIVIRLKEDILEMETQMNEKKMKISRLQVELGQANIKIRQVQKKMLQNCKEMTELSKQLQLQKDITIELKSQIQSKQFIIAQHTTQINRLKQQNTRYQSLNYQMSLQIDQITRKLASQSQYKQKQISNLWSDKVQAWKKVALENQNRTSVVVGQISGMKLYFEKESLRQKEENEHLIMKIKDIQQVKNNLQKINKELQFQNKSLNLRIDEVQRQNKQMLQQTNELKQSIIKYKEQPHNYNKPSPQKINRSHSSSSISNNQSFQSIAMSRQQQQYQPNQNQCKQQPINDRAVRQEQVKEMRERERYYSMLIVEKDERIIRLERRVGELQEEEKQLRELLLLQEHKIDKCEQQHIVNNKQEQQLKQLQRKQHHQYLQPQNPHPHSQSLSTLKISFQKYKSQKQQQISQLHHLIQQKISQFQHNLNQQQTSYQQQVQHLSNIISQLQAENHSLSNEINTITQHLRRVSQQLILQKDQNQLMNSYVQKLNAQGGIIRGDITYGNRQDGGKLNQYCKFNELKQHDFRLKDDNQIDLLKKQNSQLRDQITSLKQIVQSRDHQIQSLTIKLQNLKIQLEQTTNSYEQTIQALKHTHLDLTKQLQQNKHLTNLQQHYQQQFQSLQQSFQRQLSSAQESYNTSLQQQYQQQQTTHQNNILHLKQMHAEEMNQIKKLARQKISAIKQLNHKAKVKIVEQKNQLRTHEQNINQLSHLLNEKEIFIKDLTNKIHLKDEEIQKLLLSQIAQNKITLQQQQKTDNHQLQTELEHKIDQLKIQLLATKQKHLTSQSTLTKVIESLKQQNFKLQSVNQSLLKTPSQKQSTTLNKQKLQYILVQTKKQKLQIHTLIVNLKIDLKQQFLIGHKIQAELASIDSPINLVRGRKYFSYNNNNTQEPIIVQVNNHHNLKKKYSRQQEKCYKPIIVQSKDSLLDNKIFNYEILSSKRLHSNKDECYTSSKFQAEKQHLFEPLLMIKPSKGDFNRAIITKENNNKSKASSNIPQKDIDDDNQFKMLKNPSEQNHSNDHYLDEIPNNKTLKHRLKQTPSLLIGLDNDDNFVFQRKGSVHSEIIYDCHPNNISHTKRASQFQEKSENKKLSEDETIINTKKSVEMKIIEQTIRRKKQQNQFLLFEINQKKNIKSS